MSTSRRSSSGPSDISVSRIDASSDRLRPDFFAAFASAAFRSSRNLIVMLFTIRLQHGALGPQDRLARSLLLTREQAPPDHTANLPALALPVAQGKRHVVDRL